MMNPQGPIRRIRILVRRAPEGAAAAVTAPLSTASSGRSGLPHGSVRCTALVFLLLVGPFTSLADAWDFKWLTQFGDTRTDVGAGTLIRGNTVYVTGYSFPAGRTADAYLRRYDRSGALVWATEFGTPGNETVSGMVGLGNLIVIAGGTTGTFPGQTPGGSRDVFLRAYRSNGEVAWTTQFGTAAFEGLGSNCVTTDGHDIYVTGETFGTFPGEPVNSASATFVAKLDASGHLLWAHDLGIHSYTRIGLLGISADEEGVMAVGSFAEGPNVTDPTGAYIRRLNRDGELVWQRDLVRRDFCSVTIWGVSIYDHVAYVVGQWLDLNFPNPDAPCVNPDASPVVGVVRAYDTETGDVKWQRRIAGRMVPGGENFTGAKIVSASEAGVFVGANLTESFPGHWQPTPPQRPECPGLLPGFPNEFPDSLDAYVRRYSLDGDVIWTQQFGSPVFDLVTSLSAGGNGVAVVGDTSCGITTTQSYGGGARDVFVGRLSAEPTSVVGFIQLLVGRLETLKDRGDLNDMQFNALVQVLEAALRELEAGTSASARAALLKAAEQLDTLPGGGELLANGSALRDFARDLPEPR